MPPSAKMRTKAFTLVEVLVSMLVLTILLLSVSAVVSSANKAASNSRKRIAADNEARTVFDRIADDLGHIINRTDVDFALGRNTGNDALFFFSEGSALSSTGYPTAQQNTAALLGYRINGSYQLERLGKTLILGAAPPDGMVYLTYANPAPLPSSTPSPNALTTFSGNTAWQSLIGSSPTYTGGTDTTYYHVLSESVFRFEFCYLLKPVTKPDGSVSTALYSNYPNSVSNSTTNYTYTTGLQQVQAIVVTLALLDSDTRKIVAASDLQTLSAALTDPADADLSASLPKLPAQTWDGELIPANFTGPARVAASNARIYQRTFYVGPFIK